ASPQVVRTQCVDQLSAVIDQLFSRAKHYGPRLLLLGFHFDEAHRWPLRMRRRSSRQPLRRSSPD
ncbi:hypothetical protein, partial [Mesorhizobium sp.]|uniref:hypothetical protein n=1 Tax=Mesorhizobium sp. TaxID=1871066 RepID=UPI0025C36A42